MKSNVVKRIFFGLVVLGGGYALYCKFKKKYGEPCDFGGGGQTKDWIAKVKEEIQENIKPFQQLTEEEYERVADTAAYHYGRLYRINAREFADALEDLRADWDRVREKWQDAMEKSKKKIKDW